MDITDSTSLQGDQDPADYNIPLEMLYKAYALAEAELRRIPTVYFDDTSSGHRGA